VPARAFDSCPVSHTLSLSSHRQKLTILPASLHVIGFFRENIATVVSLMAVALPFGGTLALTVMATVFNNVSGIGPDSPFRDFTALSSVPEPTKSHIVNQAKVSCVSGFRSASHTDPGNLDGRRLGLRSHHSVHGLGMSTSTTYRVFLH
jgi:hypothetical protein